MGTKSTIPELHSVSLTFTTWKFLYTTVVGIDEGYAVRASETASGFRAETEFSGTSGHVTSPNTALTCSL
jgi:hypothetical protein